MSQRPHRLEPSLVEKIWGATELEPWFPTSKKTIGEVCFPAGDIQFKFLYTTGPLSVQVHPGKTEMWYVMRAAPDARIALGFREPISKERLREVSLSGEIENLLDWVPVAAGDAILSPTGTVHALGSGLVVAEIQQNTPITYRLFDYGRSRGLHLEKAIAVARCDSRPGKSKPEPLPGGGRRLVSCEFFVTDLYHWDRPVEYVPSAETDHLLVVLEGRGALAGEPFVPGHVWRVPAGGRPFPIKPSSPCRVLRTCPPEVS